MNHSYIPLDQYRRKWIFNHKDLPVSDQDKAAILPLDQKSAMEVWNRWISNKSSCAEDFTKGDWASRSSTWHQTEYWQSHWDSEDNSLPEPLAEFIDWPADALYISVMKVSGDPNMLGSLRPELEMLSVFRRWSLTDKPQTQASRLVQSGWQLQNGPTRIVLTSIQSTIKPLSVH